MKTEVTKDEFYKKVGPLDAVVSVEGDFPYTTKFKMRRLGGLIGESVDSINEEEDEGEHIITKYFIIQ